ncbi:activator of HSP90 ATPase [Paenibacillus sp. CCS19]|uniref:SRPBCC family protein n=1 Tax=Paenibacillus sp. CCS19 TaxID=3158387 RepID=UPI00255D69C0|nr:SRPBCC family protein [Paenibacillus cellulosilyticus]GMK41208.1 activator of HSP90 ATPase [Paenibacillus cellulosilyticus]
MTTLNEIPAVKAEMMIRKPVAEVFEAFVDPAITTRFWFTKSSGRLETGSRVRWEWEMYGVSDELSVLTVEPNKRIRIQWSGGTETEWTFTPRADSETMVEIVTTGYAGSGDEIVGRAVDDMGGYTIVLCGAKAYLEHGIALNLVADKAPYANVNR